MSILNIYISNTDEQYIRFTKTFLGKRNNNDVGDTLQTIYKSFIKSVIRDYVIGSAVAVLGVGSIFIFAALQVPRDEAMILFGILLISIVIMVAAELFSMYRHIRPIRDLFPRSTVRD